MNTKIIRRTEKSFTVEIEIPYGGTMLEGEEILQASFNEAGSISTGELLQKFDTDGSPLEEEGKRWTSRGKYPEVYQTPYGEIKIERHIYQTSKGGKTFCPLEKNARIILTATPKFAKMLSSKYAEFGAKRVVYDLENNHQRTVARSFIQNVCQTVGEIAQEKEEKWTYEIPQTEEITTVSIGLDGTCMLMTEDGYRQAMVGTIALYDQKGERKHTIYSAATPEYGKNTFLTRLSSEIERIQEIHPKARYLGIADGAKDNWKYLEQYHLEEILDFYHASEYIGIAGEILFIEKKASQEWISKKCHQLKNEEDAARNILKEMETFSLKHLSQDNRKKVEATKTYFSNNLSRMQYWKYTSQNMPIGSGVTEAACKVIIKQRLGGSGMKWKEKGASAVLFLRCLNYTDDRWNQFWSKIDRYGFGKI